MNTRTLLAAWKRHRCCLSLDDHLKSNLRRALTFAAFALTSAFPAAAGVLACTEAGEDVVATFSGSRSLPQSEFLTIGCAFTGAVPDKRFVGTTASFIPGYRVSCPSSFGNGGRVEGLVEHGKTPFVLSNSDRFEVLAISPLQDSDRAEENAWNIGGEVTRTGGLRLEGQDFESMGLTPGTEFRYTLLDFDDISLHRSSFAATNAPSGVDTFTFRIASPKVIHLHAAGLLLIVLIGGLGALARVRRRKG